MSTENEGTPFSIQGRTSDPVREPYSGFQTAGWWRGANPTPSRRPAGLPFYPMLSLHVDMGNGTQEDFCHQDEIEASK